jgi:pimeloyl-ACP methyl ester carboxylesterase
VRSVQTSEVSFESGRERCAATLYLPGDVAGLLPCVVMGHGFSLTRRDGIPGFARRLAAAGFAALAFDYRHWGDSGGEPRCWVAVREQIEDFHAAVGCARGLPQIDARKIAVWGMSLGGGHTLTIAAADQRVAAVIALVPAIDGLATVRYRRSSPGADAQLLWRAAREAVTGRPVPVPVASEPGGVAVFDTPEALSGFRRLTAGAASSWANQVNPSSGFGTARYRPVSAARRITAPVLLQVGEHDGMAPLAPAEKARGRLRSGELISYPVDHFGAFWPEHIDQVAADQVDFLVRALGSGPQLAA